MSKITDDTLRQALKALPREVSRASFTRELMARLPDRSPGRRSTPRFYLGLAAVTLATTLLTAVAVPRLLDLRASRSQAVEVVATPSAGESAKTELSPDARLAEAVGSSARNDRRATTSHDLKIQRLLAERQAILVELQQFRRETEAVRPVLYLGGDESVDLVVDLAAVARRRPTGSVRPAAYRPN